MTSWSPRDYLKFADERGRPARDLLGQVPLSSPRLVFDLGCGPGNSTALLAEAYPEAELVGVDHSKEMLSEARRALPSRVFVQADLARWLPEKTPDLLFSNAAFHWVPDHLEVMRRLAGGLEGGGVLAVQMPDNLEEPSHLLMRDAAASGPWSRKLAGADRARAIVRSPRAYYDALRPLCSRIEAWRTTYYHWLEGPGAIVEFLRSTGLRPYLAPLDEGERQRFLAAYTERIAEAYPAGADGKSMFPFPRLFLVAVR
jgi:trans-aconitate 2-methyltransferase